MVKTVEAHTPLYSSFRRLVTTTHHTEIGLLYFVTALFFFFVAGSMAMIIRTELVAPGPTVTNAAVYNQLFTMHGTTMVFLWIMPALAGFINYLLP
ncbi:MAG: cbb3-type cytochrome c oxidase subunit I, partial [Candidatus Bathyarchaeia archaeon]